jgi:hypothetical protein
VLSLGRENIRDGSIEVHFGKTANSRRRIPLSDRVEGIMRARLQQFDSEAFRVTNRWMSEFNS